MKEQIHVRKNRHDSQYLNFCLCFRTTFRPIVSSWESPYGHPTTGPLMIWKLDNPTSRTSPCLVNCLEMRSSINLNYSDAIFRFRIPTYEYLSWIYISFDNLLHFRGNGFGNLVYFVYGFQLFNITKVLNSLFHPILQNTFSSALGYIF